MGALEQKSSYFRLYTLLIQNKILVDLIDNSFYNQKRYAYKFNIVLINFTKNAKICKYISGNVRKTDNYIKISDDYIIIIYPFIDYLDALNASAVLLNTLQLEFVESVFKKIVINSESHSITSEFIKHLMLEFYSRS